MGARAVHVVVPAVVALAALGWGAVSLHGVFVEERDEAVARATREERSTVFLAEQMLTRGLSDGLAKRVAMFGAIEKDPLAADADLLWVDAAGRRRLPRVTGESGVAEAQVTALWNAWDAGRFTADDELVAERGQILARIAAGAAGALGELVVHRTHHRLPLAVDLASQVWALRKVGAVDAAVARRILRDGFADVPGLQRAVVAERGRLHARDITVLQQEILDLCARHRVAVDGFESALSAGARIPVAHDEHGPDTAITERGGAFVVRGVDGAIHGFRVDVRAELATLQGEMRALGILGDDDSFGLPPVDVVDVTAPFLQLHSPRLARAPAAAHTRYLVKTALLGTTLLLALLAVAAGWLAHARRVRLVAVRSGFLSAVSHELRTPLASMRLLAETMERKIGPDARVRDYPRRLLAEVDGMAAMVENLLSYHRLDRGKLVPTLSRVSVREIVENAAHDVTSHAVVPVEFDLSLVGDARVEVDPALLQLAFGNLFRNACQYNDNTPVHVQVSTVEGPELAILVADNGRGMAPEEHERVFEDFSRGSSSRAGDRGSGLGLAICRQVMRVHGGTIAVHTSTPAGTTFVLRLPVRVEA